MAANADSLPAVLTVQELADRLRVSKQVVYKMVEDKQIPSFRLRRQYRIPSDSVRALFFGGTVPDLPPQSQPEPTTTLDSIKAEMVKQDNQGSRPRPQRAKKRRTVRASKAMAAVAR